MCIKFKVNNKDENINRFAVRGEEVKLLEREREKTGYRDTS